MRPMRPARALLSLFATWLAACITGSPPPAPATNLRSPSQPSHQMHRLRNRHAAAVAGALAAVAFAMAACAPPGDASSARRVEMLTTSTYSQDVAFSPDGGFLTDGAREWKLAGGRLVGSGGWAEFSHGFGQDAYVGFGTIAYSPDGRLVATGSTASTRSVVVWNARTGAALTTMDAVADLRAVAFSPDGRTLATGSDDRIVRLWDVASGQPIATLTGATGLVASLAFSPDGGTLSAGCYDGGSVSWDVRAPAQRDTAQAGADVGALEGAVWASAEPGTSGDTEYSPDGRLFGHAAFDHFSVWSVAGRARQESLGAVQPRDPSRFIGAARFSPDGGTVALAISGKDTELWDVRSARRFAVLHTGAANRLAFSPNGRLLAVAQPDYPASHIEIWDISRPLASLTR